MARNTIGNTERSTLHNTSFTSDNTYNTDGARITEAIHDEYLAALAARPAPEGISSLLGKIVDDGLERRLSRGQRAAQAWYEANGDLERRHTCGVYVRQARVAGASPVLGVYVDTNARLTDLRANKDLYLARLANVGYQVSDIEFRLSRTRRSLYDMAPRGPRNDGDVPSRDGSDSREDLPSLSRAEEERVAELTRDLPEGLRQSASRAISLTMRRKKTDNTQ